MNPHHPANSSLRGIPLFRNFDPSELDELLEFAEPCLIPAGRDIVCHGESGQSMFVITEGRAFAVAEQPDGTELTVAEFGAGDVLGGMALPGGQPQGTDVMAMSDCMVMTITTGLMRMLGLAYPRTAFKLAMGVLELATQPLSATDEWNATPPNPLPAPGPGGTVMAGQRVA
ncbi:MAG: cyclic nucleotide-binding domain-containing protein [Chthoniobacteraceae bacterium]